MSTPDPVVIDPRFRAGDRYVSDGSELIRDVAGRWKTGWGLWELSDQHLTGHGDWIYGDGPGVWRMRDCACGHSRSHHCIWRHEGDPQPCRHPSGCACKRLRPDVGPELSAQGVGSEG